MFSPFSAIIKITVTQNLPIIINAVVFCNFKAGKCKFNFDRETELWCYVNSANSKIILVQNKLQEINSTQNVKNKLPHTQE